MTDDSTNSGPNDWVEIEVTSEGISATAYTVTFVATDCTDCDGDEDCPNCKGAGSVMTEDAVVVDEWWVPWAEVIKDESSWVAFQDVAIEHTEGTLEVEP